MQDRVLLKKLKKDPEEGMKALIQEYAPLVYAVVRGKLNRGLFSDFDIEACVADTFSEFYLSFDKYNESLGSIKAYLCVMARHNAIDLVRKKMREGMPLPLEEEILEDDDLEEALFESELFSELVKEIKALGEPDCEIVMRKFYFGESSKQIAEALDMTVSNIDTRTHRALLKLRKKMGVTGYETKA